ncbi:hypothetical protein KY290_017646 [Solanum tuberosum]|uniref:Uncharacterized protein n=1 Tax=Solanum tuberosum TaxID=4113 RepID=A0ABQ7VDY5_SOLTU|nr:hypothetical protein KY290_017646 [Solanum tuberosum]
MSTLACKIYEGQTNPTVSYECPQGSRQKRVGMARSIRNATNRAKLKTLHHIDSKPVREIIYQKGGKMAIHQENKSLNGR